MADPTQLYAQLIAAFQRELWSEAERLANLLLPMAQQHAGVYGIAGVVQLELGKPEAATPYLQRASELDPTRADFVTLLAKSLISAHHTGEAIDAARRAAALAGNDASTWDALGVIYTQAQAHGSATEAFRRAVALAPKQPMYRFNLGTALISLGELDAAARELATCIELEPRQWAAHLALAQLRRQAPTRQQMERTQSLLSQYSNHPEASAHLNLTLAKAHEDLDDHAQAFIHFTRGKAARRSQRPYTAQRDITMFDTLMRSFPLPQPAAPGASSAAPIFVVGLPRTGTTLVERILSCHPQVHAAGELQNFARVLQQQSESDAPFLLRPDLPERTRLIDWAKLGAAYLDSTPPATAQKPFFTDKLPHNFLHIGFIAHALPQARIICLRRHPLDTCLSNFSQLFDASSPYFDYSNNLLDTGRYYVLFDRLMKHWKRLFPEHILELDYETLVTSPEPTIRELLAFCKLPWDERCLRIEANEAPVATFSASQVRAPIHASSMYRWKKYETQLDELRQLLASADIALPP
ncbi:sulfotransferase [Dyella sp. 20L07]|uniref:tetratricopeptide repeat-containing sulfotransferase family protein n=1 Tax=Dyella sp. 20L07 TaxID=3384240 RepID=UPI003D2C4CBC